MSDELDALYIVVNTNPPFDHRHPHRFAPHRDYPSAAMEAQRLAREHPGQEFTVFCAVSSAIRKEPITVTLYKNNDRIPF